MNYVAHLYLAQPRGPSWIGNLMGDFMTGTSLASLPEDLRRGVENHYAIDRFTDQHRVVGILRSAFREPYRKTAGICLDIAFDHMLIQSWDHYSKEPFQDFLNRVYRGLKAHESLWNDKMKGPLRRMIDKNWLPAYGSMEGLERALYYLGKRFTFANPVAASIVEIERLYDDIQKGFHSFFPELVQAVKDWGIEERES